MKKLFLCAAIAVLAFINVNAQEVTYGVKGGVNFATLGGDLEDTKSRTSFHIGGVAEISISEKFSVQPELLYSSQGTKSEFSESFEGFTASEKIEIKVDYINLPIMAKYYVTEAFSVEAGPQISFLISAKQDFEYSDSSGESESGSEDIKDVVKSVDFGLGFGAGYKMNSGLNFSARYNMGLSNVNDDSDASEIKVKNNVFQLSVGYMF